MGYATHEGRKKKEPEDFGTTVPLRTREHAPSRVEEGGGAAAQELARLGKETLRQVSDLLSGKESYESLAGDNYDLLARLNSEYGFVDDDFLNFKKPVDILPIPSAGYALEQLEDAVLSSGSGNGMIGIEFTPSGQVRLINRLFVPPTLLKDKKRAAEIASILRKIASRGTAADVTMALGCWSQLNGALTERYSHRMLSDFHKMRKEEKLSSLEASYASLQGELAAEAYSNLKAISSKAGSGRARYAGTERFLEISRKCDRAKRKLDAERARQAADLLLGNRAVSAIERGIKKGLYTELEQVFFARIKEGLSESRKKLSAYLSGETMELLSMEGMDSLSDIERKEFESALDFVAQLEMMAWKTDLLELEPELYHEEVFYLPSPAPPPAAVVTLPRTIEVITREEKLSESTKEKRRMIMQKAEAYCDFLASAIKHQLHFLDKKEKAEYVKSISSLREETGKPNPRMLYQPDLTGGYGRTPTSLHKVMEEMGETMTSLTSLLGEKQLDALASDPRQPLKVRTLSYVKLGLLRYGLGLVLGGAAAGGVVGGIAGRSAVGAGAGAKAGAEAASLVVGLAGAYLTSDALYRYISGKGDQQAVSDMKLGSTYMAFALMGPAGKLAAPLKLAAAGGLTASNSLLAYEHIRAGEYMEVPMDVAYVAVGAFAFVRVAGGMFRAVPLRAAVAADEIVVGTSAGISRFALRGAKALGSLSARALKTGYSPAWVATNAVFSGYSNWSEISSALKHGNYSLAQSLLGRGFGEFTRDIVAFDFALSGAWGAGKAGVRYFRREIPSAFAKVAKYLEATGLFEDIALRAQQGGVNLASPKLAVATNEVLIDLAFGCEGMVSADYVSARFSAIGQRIRPRHAREIAAEIRERTLEAKQAFSFPESALKRKTRPGFWKRVQTRIDDGMRNRAARLAVRGGRAAVLVGSVAYIEGKGNEARRFGEVNSWLRRNLSTSEAQFVRDIEWGILRDRFSVPQVSQQDELFDAVSLVDSIAVEIEDGTHPLSSRMEVWGKDHDARLRLLFSCALALMMNNRKVTGRSLTSLAGRMLTLEHVSNAGGKTMPIEGTTHISTLSLLASLVLRDGEEAVSEAYSEVVAGVGEYDLPRFMDYGVAALYSSVMLGGSASPVSRAAAWAADNSYAVFSELVGDESWNPAGWDLPLLFSNLIKSKTPSTELSRTTLMLWRMGVKQWRDSLGSSSFSE